MSANQCALLDCCNERRPLFTAGDVLGFQRKTHTHTRHLHTRIESLSLSHYHFERSSLFSSAYTSVYTVSAVNRFSKYKIKTLVQRAAGGCQQFACTRGPIALFAPRALTLPNLAWKRRSPFSGVACIASKLIKLLVRLAPVTSASYTRVFNQI